MPARLAHLTPRSRIPSLAYARALRRAPAVTSARAVPVARHLARGPKLAIGALEASGSGHPCLALALAERTTSPPRVTCLVHRAEGLTIETPPAFHALQTTRALESIVALALSAAYAPPPPIACPCAITGLIALHSRQPWSALLTRQARMRRAALAGTVPETAPRSMTRLVVRACHCTCVPEEGVWLRAGKPVFGVLGCRPCTVLATCARPAFIALTYPGRRAPPSPVASLGRIAPRITGITEIPESTVLAGFPRCPFKARARPFSRALPLTRASLIPRAEHITCPPVLSGRAF